MGGGHHRDSLARYETAGKPIKGYEGEVVPGVRASYSYTTSETPSHARCEIRIKMTESQFRDLGDFSEKMYRAFVQYTDNARARYNYNGYAEFYVGYVKISETRVEEVTDRLVEVAKLVEASIRLFGVELRK
jgi:hypothetical protein